MAQTSGDAGGKAVGGPSSAARRGRASLGMVGRKVGMMRIFSDDGDAIPVTVIDLSNNRVAQVKTAATDGYDAVQVASGKRRPIRVTKAMAGHYAKAGIEAGARLHEFPLTAEKTAELKAGAALSVEIFPVGSQVDVSGVTIGKGYAGTIKRHHFSSGRASHGNSRSHNVPGSIGMAQDPGRVFPGKRMTGHLGADSRTAMNLIVARVDVERQLLLVKGAVPGHKEGSVVVRPSVKPRSIAEKKPVVEKEKAPNPAKAAKKK